MKIQKTILPDKIIKLSHGDEVRIYGTKNKISFDFFCDGTGNSFELTKEELQELIK